MLGSATAPLAYWQKNSFRAFFWAVMAFLYAPILVLILFSFNDSKRNIVWKGFTWKYYDKALANGDLLQALLNSLTIGFFTTLLSLFLGTLTAIMFWRFSFRGKGFFEAFVILPIIIPEITMGIAMMAFFSYLHWSFALPWPGNLIGITCAHVSFSFPVVAMIVRARLLSLRPELEEVARDLGARDFQVMRDVFLPHIRPALIAGGLLSFTLSLEDFVVTFFTSGPNTITLPIKIYSMVRFSITPEINAASTILMALTLSLTCLFLWIRRHKL